MKTIDVIKNIITNHLIVALSWVVLIVLTALWSFDCITVTQAIIVAAIVALVLAAGIVIAAVAVWLGHMRHEAEHMLDDEDEYLKHEEVSNE